MNLIFTKQPPDKPGYYWWTNFGERTPCILYVSRDANRWYACNEEFGFFVRIPTKVQLELEMSGDTVDVRETDGDDTYKHGDELWCYIPHPWLPNLTKQISADSY
jgi:hypothetical protein